MHSGLGLILNRNKSLFKGLLDKFSGASAAYSLRRLAKGEGDVVEVRRSSDDAVQSFTAAEVADGTLEAWVNADVDKLDLQPETGGLVGNVSNETANSFDFSVNNEGSTGYKNLLLVSQVTAGTYIATFDVELNSGSLTGLKIRSGNPVEEAAFVIGENSITVTPSGIAGIYFQTSSTSVADVSITNITLTQTTADGHVRTWYDQSGSDNHAVQTTAANQPKIVDAGTYLGEIDFDGSDDELASEASVDIAQLATAFSVVKPEDAGANKYIWTIGGTSGIISFLNSSEEAALAAGSPLVDGTLSTVDDNLKFDFCNTTSSIVAINGSSGTSGTIGTRSGNDVIRIGGRGGADLMFGTIRELIIYNSDQSANRTAIEANIADEYGITLS